MFDFFLALVVVYCAIYLAVRLGAKAKHLFVVLAMVLIAEFVIPSFPMIQVVWRMLVDDSGKVASVVHAWNWVAIAGVVLFFGSFALVWHIAKLAVKKHDKEVHK